MHTIHARTHARRIAGAHASTTLSKASCNLLISSRRHATFNRTAAEQEEEEEFLLSAVSLSYTLLLLLLLSNRRQTKSFNLVPSSSVFVRLQTNGRTDGRLTAWNTIKFNIQLIDVVVVFVVVVALFPFGKEEKFFV